MSDREIELGVCGFEGVVTARSIARLQVSQVTVHGTQTLRRTPTMIARCSRPAFVLVRVRAGRGVLRHRGGEVPLCEHECVLLDGREPYELSFQDGSDSLWLHLPVDWVEGHLTDPHVAVAVSLGNRQPWSAMLRDVVDTVHADDGASPAFLVARSLCTALALTVDAIEVRSTAHSRKTFKSLQRTLAELAPTCNVTVAQIAQAHGISPRYVHAIFSANGTSCGRELIRVRLERAQRLLLDSTQTERSIDDIAWQCGFSDAAHFRRRFRALFGVPPSAMRTVAARSIPG
jgi:AraC-like DNA-binding protein